MLKVACPFRASISIPSLSGLLNFVPHLAHYSTHEVIACPSDHASSRSILIVTGWLDSLLDAMLIHSSMPTLLLPIVHSQLFLSPLL